MAKSTMALYGTMALERTFCTTCNTFSFVRRGEFVCCGSQAAAVPEKYERIAATVRARKPPPKHVQMRILSEQDNRCIYCGEKFGTVKERKGKPVTLVLNWDHKLPWAFSRYNRSVNISAACHVCNGIKSDKIFETIGGAQIHIEKRRRALGYNW